METQPGAAGGRPDCPLERTVAIIGAKWTILILRDLAGGPRRFGELLASLRGISPTTLSQRLRALQREGLCLRHSYDTIPPRVEYSLTDKGRSLASIVEAMREWGERYA